VGCEVAGHNLGLAGSETPESDPSDKGKMIGVTETSVSAHRTESPITASGKTPAEDAKPIFRGGFSFASPSTLT
jgi:hypothetical protein